jgi:hypothetical protein
MAQFKNKLWTDETVVPSSQLLLATMLWLRALDSDIGLINMIRLLVPPSNDLYFGQNVLPMPENRLVISDGTVYEIYGLRHSFVWQDTIWTHLNKHFYETVSRECYIHISWIQWALAHAMVRMSDAGIDWFPKPKPKTIGGWEVADL